MLDIALPQLVARLNVVCEPLDIAIVRAQCHDVEAGCERRGGSGIGSDEKNVNAARFAREHGGIGGHQFIGHEKDGALDAFAFRDFAGERQSGRRVFPRNRHEVRRKRIEKRHDQSRIVRQRQNDMRASGIDNQCGAGVGAARNQITHLLGGAGKTRGRDIGCRH